MVGIFSRFSITRNGHRRTQSALERLPVLAPNADAYGNTGALGGTHGIEVTVDFKPVEHPVEPLDDNDKPIRCPLTEPSILNDGRLWKERVSCVHVRRRSELSLVKEGEVGGSEPLVAAETRPKPSRSVLPTSLSAPEHNILQLLEESGM